MRLSGKVLIGAVVTSPAKSPRLDLELRLPSVIEHAGQRGAKRDQKPEHESGNKQKLGVPTARADCHRYSSMTTLYVSTLWR